MHFDPESRKQSLRIAVICSSNMNRSMEGHRLLQKKGFNISSYGTGTQVRRFIKGGVLSSKGLGTIKSCRIQVKLPGTTADKPNVYPFDTPYEVIYQDLCSKDKKAYTQNGVLNMLDRNRRIKRNPEKFQQNRDCFDIILSCEGKNFQEGFKFRWKFF